MRVLVTGGAGFIGSNLCRRLLVTGHDVTVLDDLSTGAAENLAGVDVRFVGGSILDRGATVAAASGVDAIVHLAARPSVPRSVADPRLTNEINVSGTINVLDAARAAEAHVVVASSSSVYGANPALPKRESDRPMPMSPYAVSKLATEAYALAYQECYGLPALVFRLFNVYGPLQSSAYTYAIPGFVEAALEGRPLPVHGDGTQSRDFTYVGSVVDVLAGAVERRVTSPDPVNLAFGTRLSILDVIGELEQVLGRPLPRVHAEPRLGDMAHTQADPTNLLRLFPDATPTPFAAGLRTTVEWLVTRKPLATV